MLGSVRGTRVSGFMCGHQGATVLSEEGYSGQRTLARGQVGCGWMGGGEVGAPGRHVGDGVELGLRSDLLTCWGGWMLCGGETVEPELLESAHCSFLKNVS